MPTLPDSLVRYHKYTRESRGVYLFDVHDEKGTKNPRYKDRGQDGERPEPGGLTRLASEGSIASDR
jgi:hypothetical protein